MNIAQSKHFSQLVKDYLTAFETSGMREYFALSPFERGSGLRDLAQELVKRASSAEGRAQRTVLVEELRTQHSRNDTLSEAVRQNLDLLSRPTTLAVVTGQQVGIFGGPLYTIYKALSALALARELAGVLEGSHVVPVFWQETEDHDLDEASHYGIIDQGGNYCDLTYAVADAEEIKRRQVGSIKLGAAELGALSDALSASVQQTEFTSGIFELYRRCYTPGSSFADAQLKLIGAFTQDDGLLVLNANTKKLKEIGRKLFSKELNSPSELQKVVQSQTAALGKSYHTQLEPSPVNLFLMDNDRRYKIERDGERFSYDDKHIGKEELMLIVENEPQRLSPNVVMRPLYQDTLLPTVAYVGGPGEIAYFAQLKNAYDWAGIPMPLIVPRFSATIVEDKTAKTLEKLGVSVEELLEHGAALINKAVTTEAETFIAQTFDERIQQVETLIESLRPTVVKADGSLDGALSALKGKLASPLKDFASKTLAAERKKSATLRAQLEKALHGILPGGSLQERRIGLLYYLNKYGIGFLEHLKKRVLSAPSAAEHQIIDIREILQS